MTSAHGVGASAQVKKSPPISTWFWIATYGLTRNSPKSLFPPLSVIRRFSYSKTNKQHFTHTGIGQEHMRKRVNFPNSNDIGTAIAITIIIMMFWMRLINPPQARECPVQYCSPFIPILYYSVTHFRQVPQAPMQSKQVLCRGCRGHRYSSRECSDSRYPTEKGGVGTAIIRNSVLEDAYTEGLVLVEVPNVEYVYILYAPVSLRD